MNIGFKPKKTAIVYNYRGPMLSGSPEGIINIISHTPNNIDIQTESSDEALLVLSSYIMSLDGNAKLMVSLVRYIRQIMFFDLFIFLKGK